jgi:hypothetical protein
MWEMLEMDARIQLTIGDSAGTFIWFVVSGNTAGGRLPIPRPPSSFPPLPPGAPLLATFYVFTDGGARLAWQDLLILPD